MVILVAAHTWAFRRLFRCGFHGGRFPCKVTWPTLQLAFAIDEEVASHYDFVLRTDATKDFHTVFKTPPYADLARFHVSVTAMDKHSLARAGIEHRACGDTESRGVMLRKANVKIHARFQTEARVWSLNAGL